MCGRRLASPLIRSRVAEDFEFADHKKKWSLAKKLWQLVCTNRLTLVMVAIIVIVKVIVVIVIVIVIVIVVFVLIEIIVEIVVILVVIGIIVVTVFHKSSISPSF